jgi:hypothetical protein
VAGIWDSQYLVALHRDGVHGIMETRNTKLEIYRKAIAKHHMPLLPMCFRRNGPRRPFTTSSAVRDYHG